MTRVKICGLTRPEDVEAACALGAAYVGFNFSRRSPRRVDLPRAAELSEAAAADVLRVGVFVDEDYGEIAEAIRAGELHLVQLHRPLRAEDFARIRRPIVAVAHPGGEEEPPADDLVERSFALLVDGSRPGLPGGSGARFDWSLVEERPWSVPLFLAGGLDPGNVTEAIRRVRPDTVDVASGVEIAVGKKDPELLREFFDAVERADRET